MNIGRLDSINFASFPPNGTSVSMTYDVIQQCLQVSSVICVGKIDEVCMNHQDVAGELIGDVCFRFGLNICMLYLFPITMFIFLYPRLQD